MKRKKVKEQEIAPKSHVIQITAETHPGIWNHLLAPEDRKEANS